MNAIILKVSDWGTEVAGAEEPMDKLTNFIKTGIIGEYIMNPRAQKDPIEWVGLFYNGVILASGKIAKIAEVENDRKILICYDTKCCQQDFEFGAGRNAIRYGQYNEATGLFTVTQNLGI